MAEKKTEILVFIDPDPETIGCKACGHLACVCEVLADHREGCAFRRAATCAVGIECPHGRDVCPTCDPCTCEDANDG